MATDGRSGGAEWYASVRADHRLSVRHDSEGLAAGKQRAAPGVLKSMIAYPGFRFIENYPSFLEIVRYEDILL
jgi:hypothetical protein